jgi:hypothetical protein
MKKIREVVVEQLDVRCLFAVAPTLSQNNVLINWGALSNPVRSQAVVGQKRWGQKMAEKVWQKR